MGTKCFLAIDDEVVSDQFDAETFVVNFRNGRYYAMRGSATAIWRLLRNPQTAESITERLDSSLGKLPSDAISEISSFLDRLESEGLASHSQLLPAPENDDLENIHEGGYQSPILDVFGDLSELVTIDPVHGVDNERGWPEPSET